jgi:tetratricopeptide (TPR) repeat protein
VVTILCGVRREAEAVQWQALNGTTRYKAAYDEHSLRLTPQGRMEIWFRFIPRGEAERKAAAREYGEKLYRSHLEYYEIDCSEQTAILGLIDIFGASRARLKRLQGSTQPDPILPGSLLDAAAQRICPVMNDEIEDDNENGEPGQSEAPDNPGNRNGLPSEKLQQIEILQEKTKAKDATADAWKELGNIYFDTDQPVLAIKAYERALALNPEDADTLNDQGAMYRQTGDFKRALKNFEKAYSIDQHNLESLYNSAYIYAFDLDNTPKALVLWRRYIEMESKSEMAQQVQSFIDRYGK